MVGLLLQIEFHLSKLYLTCLFFMTSCGIKLINIVCASIDADWVCVILPLNYIDSIQRFFTDAWCNEYTINLTITIGID